MNKIKKNVAVALGIAVSAAVGGAVATSVMNSASYARAERTVADARATLAEGSDLSTVFKTVSKAVEPSVVQIRTKTTVANPMSRFRNLLPFGPQGGEEDGSENPDSDGSDQAEGSGSGVIMTVDGDTAYILTNNHVVQNANSLDVVLNDSRIITEAKVVGTDPKTDLAVVKIKASNLIASNWGDSTKLEKGDWVIAFGAPFGYVGSMTHGIVSALNRQVGILGPRGFEEFIQTDAAINPGNSGGPLVNTRGEVVGINTLIASRSGGFSGLGFAVPTKIARPVFEQLKSEGRITRGYLGVSISSVAEPEGNVKALVESTGYKGKDGVFIAGTERGGPADGTLLAGDIITGINGKLIPDVKHLRETVASTSPGTEITLKVVREGKEQDVKVKVGEQPDEAQIAQNNGTSPRLKGQGPARVDQAAGIALRSLTEPLAKQYGLDGIETGALITNVAPGTPAFRAGLRPGDLITRIDGKEVSNAQEALKHLRAVDLAKGVRLNVTNREGSRFVLIREK